MCSSDLPATPGSSATGARPARRPAEIRATSAERRHEVRHARSRPIVDALHVWLQEQVPRLPGSSELAKAMRHALRHWPGLVAFLDDGRIEMGGVENRRGGGSRPGGCRRHFRAAPAIRTDVTPFPVPARQTGRADFPHPAFSQPIRPSLSAGRRVGAERCRGRVCRRDTRPGSGQTRRLVVPFGASTSGGPVARCISG